jgi:hypothetical protein
MHIAVAERSAVHPCSAELTPASSKKDPTPMHTADVVKLRGRLLHACTLFRNVLCLWHEVSRCGDALAPPSSLNHFSF